VAPHAAVRRFVELLPEIGELVSIRATFSFVIADEDDVRMDPGSTAAA